MSIRSSIAPVVLLATVLIIATWMTLAHRASQSSHALKTDVQRLAGFFPQVEGYRTTVLRTRPTHLEPTILAYLMRESAQLEEPETSRKQVMIRLSHGYNMVDCMRIKGYEVTPLDRPEGPPAIPVECWRLKSREGAITTWATLMLRATDLGVDQIGTQAMAFPRVGTPDELSWNPTGLKWSSFRHPIRNLRSWLRAKWNASRCDLLTFLRLRQPAWVSDTYFTVVAEGPDPMERGESEECRRLVTLLIDFQKQLLRHAEERSQTP